MRRLVQRSNLNSSVKCQASKQDSSDGNKMKRKQLSWGLRMSCCYCNRKHAMVIFSAKLVLVHGFD